MLTEAKLKRIFVDDITNKIVSKKVKNINTIKEIKNDKTKNKYVKKSVTRGGKNC